MTNRRPLFGAAFVVVGVGVALVVALLGSWSAPAPAAAGLPLVARATLNGAIAPDLATGEDPASGPRSPYGQHCIEGTERPAGQLSLCWEAYRDPRDADPTKDYYRLRVYGTFGGERGTGTRWMSVRAVLVGDPADDVFEPWPVGRFDGSCQQFPVPFGEGVIDAATLCSRTEGSTDVEDWSHVVTWLCVGCLLPDHANREIALYEQVAVSPGTVPSWEIYADIGS
jgi:hypothetical protein